MTLKQKHFLNTNFTSDHFIFFDLLSVLIQHMSWWGLRNTVVIYKYTLLQIKKEKNLKWLIISNTYLFNCLTIINNIFQVFLTQLGSMWTISTQLTFCPMAACLNLLRHLVYKNIWRRKPAIQMRDSTRTHIKDGLRVFYSWEFVLACNLLINSFYMTCEHYLLKSYM